MARETGIKYTLDLDQFISSVKSIPNITDDQLEKMVRTWQRRNNQVTREMARASKEAEKAAKAAAKEMEEAALRPQRRWEATKKVLEGMGGPLGEIAGRAQNLGEGLGSVAGRAGLAAAGLVAVSMAATRAYGAIINFVTSATSSLDELEEMGRLSVLPPEAVTRIREWDSAARAMQLTAKEVHVEIASFLSPSFTNLADAILGAKSALDQLGDGLGDQAADVLQKVADRFDVTELALGSLGIKGQALVWVYRQMVAEGKELREELDRQQEELDQIAEYGPVWDPQALSAHRAAKAAKALAEAQREAAAVARAQATAEGMLYDLRSDGLTAEQRAIEAAERRALQIEQLAAVIDDQALVEQLQLANTQRLTRELMEIERQRAEAKRQQDEAEEERRRRLHEAHLQRLAEQQAREQQTQRAIVAANVASATSIAGTIEMVAQMYATSREDMTDEQRRGALLAFRIAQSAAVAQATINTALAVSQALATIPPPANAIAAGAAAIAGGAQVAAIASQPPPEFPRGGLVRAHHLSADHGLVGVQQGEGIVSRRGMQQLGENGLDRLNRGEDPQPMTVVVEQTYRHRIFDRFVRDSLRRPGPLGSAVGASEAAGISER